MPCVVFGNQKRVVRKKSLNTFSLAANILKCALLKDKAQGIKRSNPVQKAYLVMKIMYKAIPLSLFSSSAVMIN